MLKVARKHDTLQRWDVCNAIDCYSSSIIKHINLIDHEFINNVSSLRIYCATPWLTSDTGCTETRVFDLCMSNENETRRFDDSRGVSDENRLFNEQTKQLGRFRLFSIYVATHLRIDMYNRSRIVLSIMWKIFFFFLLNTIGVLQRESIFKILSSLIFSLIFDIYLLCDATYIP